MAAKPMGLRWDDLQLLLAVARAGSFLAAGRDVQLATSTVSRRLERLEADVGAPLLERRSDGVRLTDAGRRLMETARDLDLQVRTRLRELPSASRALAGTIRITAGEGFADFLVGVIANFTARHPHVTFELVLENRALDLARREADVAIRTGSARPEASLVYRRLGQLRHRLWAARSYAEQHGLPRSIADLPTHAFVGFAPPLERAPVMRWLRERSATRFAMRATTFTALLAGVRGGLGIAVLPDFLGTALVSVLAPLGPGPVPVDLVFHPEARRLPHVRAFLEVLVSASPAPWREGSASTTAVRR